MRDSTNDFYENVDVLNDYIDRLSDFSDKIDSKMIDFVLYQSLFHCISLGLKPLANHDFYSNGYLLKAYNDLKGHACFASEQLMKKINTLDSKSAFLNDFTSEYGERKNPEICLNFYNKFWLAEPKFTKENISFLSLTYRYMGDVAFKLSSYF